MELPTITEGQKWCCINGCGPCGVKVVDYEYSRTKNWQGVVTERKTESTPLSACCEADLLLWDEDRQEFIEWDYQLPSV